MKSTSIQRTWLYGLAFGAFVVGAVTACGSKDDKDDQASCVTGNEGCACYPNKTCAAGLGCYSNLCVQGNSASGGSASAQGGSSSSASGGSGTPAGGEPSDGGMSSSNGNGGASASGGANHAQGGSDNASGGAPDTGQGGAPAQGGKAQGGASTAQGGKASGSGGSVTGSGGAANEVSDEHIIDNFSSCNNVISRVAGRDGGWYTFGDNDVNITPNTQSANPAPAVSSPPSGFSGGACAAWVTGGCAATADACNFAGNGFTFRSDSGPYDVSAYEGVQFDFEGDQLWVAVTTSSGFAFGTVIAASTGARRTRSFRFADLTPAAETPPGTDFDLTRIRQIEFTSTQPSGFGHAIWDVRFF